MRKLLWHISPCDAKLHGKWLLHFQILPQYGVIYAKQNAQPDPPGQLGTVRGGTAVTEIPTQIPAQIPPFCPATAHFKDG
jgi:hypothetical protein